MNLVNLKSVALISCLLLTGCGTSLDIMSKPVERTPLTVPVPEPVVLKDIEWFVITQDGDNQASAVLNEVEKKYGEKSVFALSPTGYQDLAVNLAKVKALLLQYQANLQAYKDYYEGNNIADKK
jgi:hypothetical protein